MGFSRRLAKDYESARSRCSLGDVKEVWEIMQRLVTNIVKPARSKRDS